MFDLFDPSNLYFWGVGAQWLSGRVLDSRPRGRGPERHRRHCVVSLSKNINPGSVLVQHRKTRSFITERLLIGRKRIKSNKTFGERRIIILLNGTPPNGCIGKQ